MTLSRRGFLGGLAAFLSLLVWPWKVKPFEGYRVHYRDPVNMMPRRDGVIKRRPEMKHIATLDPIGESPSVKALEDTDMLSLMLEAHEKLKDAPTPTFWLTVPEDRVDLYEKYFPGEMIQATRKIT